MQNTILSIKLKSRMAVDPLVGALDVGLQTEDGEVTISGVTDNFVQREHIEYLIKSVDGVKSVNNHLEVGPSESVTANEQTFFRNLSDYDRNRVVEEVYKKLEKVMPEPEKVVMVEVSTVGTVHLSGEVINTFIKKHIEHLIWPISGVTWIVNQLSVVSDVESDINSDQSNKIKSILMGIKLNALLIAQGLVKDAWQVSTDVGEHSIELKGDVDNLHMKDKVLECAHQITDQLEIKNSLTVAETVKVEEQIHFLEQTDEAGVHPIYADKGFVGMSPAYPIWHLNYENIADTSEDIEKRVKLVVENLHQFKCAVDGFGTAYLLGVVKDDVEMKQAEDIAWNVRGVNHVVNGLKTAA